MGKHYIYKLSFLLNVLNWGVCNLSRILCYKGSTIFCYEKSVKGSVWASLCLAEKKGGTPLTCLDFTARKSFCAPRRASNTHIHTYIQFARQLTVEVNSCHTVLTRYGYLKLRALNIYISRSFLLFRCTDILQLIAYLWDLCHSVTPDKVRRWRKNRKPNSRVYINWKLFEILFVISWMANLP